MKGDLSSNRRKQKAKPRQMPLLYQLAQLLRRSRPINRHAAHKAAGC